jgi:hypothetical protein
MKRKRFSEEQIMGVLKQAESGLPVREMVRTHGISEGTFYRWKSKFGGMEVSAPSVRSPPPSGDMRTPWPNTWRPHLTLNRQLTLRRERRFISQYILGIMKRFFQKIRLRPTSGIDIQLNRFYLKWNKR